MTFSTFEKRYSYTLPRQMVLHRRPLLRSAVLSAATLPLGWDGSISGAALPPPVVHLPLSLCGGAYCVRYELDGQPFRAVVDTGSPFLLVDGSSCRGGGLAAQEDPRANAAAALSQARWGCYQVCVCVRADSSVYSSVCV